MTRKSVSANADPGASLPQSTGPLYEKVKEYVLANIGSGAWGLNHKLPSENELVASLGVSRMTVHRALRELTSQGHLLRVQGVGTFVAPPKVAFRSNFAPNSIESDAIPSPARFAAVPSRTKDM